MKKYFSALLCFLLLLAWAFPAGAAEQSRLPGPAVMTEEEKAVVLENGSVKHSAILDAALSLLEEGNPFLVRYDLITGAQIQPRLPYGVPYLYGGQAESHVFAKAPDYVVQEAWINSPIYYRAGEKYIYGFDCYGYVKWVWKQAGRGELPASRDMLQDIGQSVFHSAVRNMPDFSTLAQALQPGDLLVTESHIAVFLGTLQQFGYTAEEAPELEAYLDWPLVIHSTVHAGIADHFDHLIRTGLQKYRVATVTDGGVGVSLLGVPTEQAPGHVFQQKQDTWYFTLPDNTWLTVLPWTAGQRYCWYR